jgi:hypothetical protein
MVGNLPISGLLMLRPATPVAGAVVTKGPGLLAKGACLGPPRLAGRPGLASKPFGLRPWGECGDDPCAARAGRRGAVFFPRRGPPLAEASGWSFMENDVAFCDKV